MQTRASAGRASYGVPALVAVLVVIADQIAKWLILDWIGPGAESHRREILGSHVALHYVENSGVAFGFLQGQGLLVPILALAVVAFLFRMYQRVASPSMWFAVGSGLIFGGSIGNLIDRVRLGFVIDFIRVATWPAFNLADSAITIGALVLAWWYWGQSSHERKRSTETARPLLDRERGARAESDR